MPGRVVDLSIPGSPIPDPIVVDTNLLAERLIVPYLSALPAEATREAMRTERFFRDLNRTGVTGLVTPTVFNEFVHVAIKYRYRQEQINRGINPNQWLRLYKEDPSILRSFGHDLESLRQLLIVNGLLFILPEHLGPIASGRRFDDELVHFVRTFGPDSNDALILMEAQRFGVNDIATLDTDMRRASSEFSLYTWL